MPDHEAVLRKLSLNDQAIVESAISIEPDETGGSNLDPKTHALVRLGALVALDAALASYQWNVGMALAAGASVEEIVGVLIAVAPAVGVARIVSAAPELALAIGYDIEGALAGTKKWPDRVD
jgi:alkylhydroperoxidase/carboxymuconolactone decarboxylase family protein YurZ